MICTLPQVRESRGLQPLCCDLCVVTFVLCVLLRTCKEHVARCSWWGLIYVLRDTGVIGSSGKEWPVETGPGQIRSRATHLHFHVRVAIPGVCANGDLRQGQRHYEQRHRHALRRTVVFLVSTATGVAQWQSVMRYSHGSEHTCISLMDSGLRCTFRSEVNTNTKHGMEITLG